MDAHVHSSSDRPAGAVPRVDKPARTSEQLTVRQHRDAATLTLHVGGVVDSITAPQLATYLEIALASGVSLLVVDLTDVEFLSAAGINLLINVQRLTRGFATVLRVVADGPITRRPLTVLGVDTLLELYPTVPAAVHDVPAPN